MRSLLKVTIIACLFSSCCPKDHIKCTIINEGKYVKATLISQTNQPDEIGFFRIGSNNKISLISFTGEEKGSAELYKEAYIRIKRCNDMYSVEGEAKTKDQIQENQIILNSDEGSKIRYHSLFQHNHTKIHKRGHIPKNIQGQGDALTTTKNSNGEALYDLDLRGQSGANLGKKGTYIVYHQQVALRDLFVNKGNTGDIIHIHYNEDLNNPDIVLDIDVCHRHGGDVMDCLWNWN